MKPAFSAGCLRWSNASWSDLPGRSHYGVQTSANGVRLLISFAART